MNLYRTYAVAKAALGWPIIVAVACALAFCAQPAPAAQAKAEPYTYIHCANVAKAAKLVLAAAERATTDSEVEALDKKLDAVNQTLAGKLILALAKRANQSGDAPAFLRKWELACTLEQA